MESIIRDLGLAESGERKIEWVKRNCDLLRMLEEEFSKTKPFAGLNFAPEVCVGLAENDTPLDEFITKL